MHIRDGVRTVRLATIGFLALAVSISAVAHSAALADTDAGHSGSVKAGFARLGDDGARYGIRQMRWVPADGGLPGYEFVLGCLDCARATYDGTGTLTNSTSLSRIPTSWTLRVPENYRQRLVARIPPGELDQTFFPPYVQTLLSDGYAVAVMDHPMPGFAAFPYDQFIHPPFLTSDYRRGYKDAGRVLKRILHDVVSPSMGSFLRRSTLITWDGQPGRGRASDRTSSSPTSIGTNPPSRHRAQCEERRPVRP